MAKIPKLLKVAILSLAIFFIGALFPSITFAQTYGCKWDEATKKCSFYSQCASTPKTITCNDNAKSKGECNTRFINCSVTDTGENPFGPITAPGPLLNFGDIQGGPGKFLTLIFRLMIVGGGIFSLFNIILAGYAFLSAGDDPKKIEGAWAKIWQSLIGLSFIAGSFVLAAIFGKLLFGDFDAIINPEIPTIEQIQ